MNIRPLLCIIGAALAVAGGAQAHHSRAMFDLQKKITLDGVVKKFDWAQPHVYIQIAALVNGKPADWTLETRSPGVLSRHGWNFKSLAVGDKVEIVAAPLTDGRPGGLLITVKRPDGKVLNGEGGAAVD